MSTSLTVSLAAITDELIKTVADAALRTAFAEIAVALREPLRIAVAGPIKGGKSTLLNALIRERIAPTDASECTKVVTQYAFTEKADEAVEIYAKDGRRWTRPLTERRTFPADLGAPAEAITHVTVRLRNRFLRDATIVDTPGLASTDKASSEATRTALRLDSASREAISRADVVLFLVTRTGRSEEEEWLRQLASSEMTTIGVIGRADADFKEFGDPFAAASEAAADLRKKFDGLVVDVFPVAALFAEASDALGEPEAEMLSRLHELTPEQRATSLLAPALFHSQAHTLNQRERDLLLEMMDLGGIREALDALDDGERGAARIRRRLMIRSGVEELRSQVQSQFLSRAQPLKAVSAITALERLSWRQSAPADAELLSGLRADLERLRSSAEGHAIAEMQALSGLSAPGVQLPPGIQADVDRLVRSTDPRARLDLDPETPSPEVRAAAVVAASRWRAFGKAPMTPPRIARGAQEVVATYEHIAAGAGSAGVDMS